MQPAWTVPRCHFPETMLGSFGAELQRHVRGARPLVRARMHRHVSSIKAATPAANLCCDAILPEASYLQNHALH